MALPTRSTISGRRNTASSRVRRSGRSSRTSVNARICSWVISSDLPNSRGDQRLAFDIAVRLAAPARVPDLRVIVGRFASACDLVRRCCPRRVALDRKAHLPGRFDNRRPALRPVTDQVLGHACDARELSILPILFHADAEALLEAPGHGIAVDRSRRLHPGVDRVLVQRPVLAVPVCPGGIEDHAVGMQLRVVVPAGSMLEHRGGYIGGKHLDLAVPVTDTGIGAMPEHSSPPALPEPHRYAPARSPHAVPDRRRPTTPKRSCRR